jgi:UDP-N-acetylglucosamine 4-epimerase
MISFVGARSYNRVRREIADTPRTWLITGVAGFIGSNLLEELLSLGQNVVGLDNFSTGHEGNLDEVMASANANRWTGTFRLVRGDIRDKVTCGQAADGVDYVLHHAALGSVPRSIDDPILSNSVNVDGFLNVLVAARDAGVKRVVYASSCAIYGDCPDLPLNEESRGTLLSPYAATKLTNEIYASVFQRTYGLDTAGLRYFNVFGQRQDPNGVYAAVIPKWIDALLAGNRCEIHGDGETSRDFCHVGNVVEANILAAVGLKNMGSTGIYNVASGVSTSLNELFRMIRLGLTGYEPLIAESEPLMTPFREGDIRRSVADISRIREELDYEPIYSTVEGLSHALEWYVDASSRSHGFAEAAVAGR